MPPAGIASPLPTGSPAPSAPAHAPRYCRAPPCSPPRLPWRRASYAIPANSVPDAERRQALNAFFFWTSWACATNRPGSDVTYTQNWPPESLIGNAPTGQTLIWSVVSFVLLLAGIAALAWYYAATRDKEHPPAESVAARSDRVRGRLPPGNRQARGHRPHPAPAPRRRGS